MVVSSIVGATQLTLGVRWLSNEYAFDAASEARTGTVVGHQETESRLFRPKVRFEDKDGTPHEFTDETAGGLDSYPVGAQVPVRVPGNPEAAILDDGFMRKGFPAIFLVAGVLVSIFAVIRLVMALRQKD